MPAEPFHEVARLVATVVVVRRTAQEFTSAAEVDRERVRVGVLLNALGRTGQRLLVDARRAPTSTDFRWAQEFRLLREELARGFERTAVVVTTKIGVLQANRLNSSTRTPGELSVFDDESAALQYLRS